MNLISLFLLLIAHGEIGEAALPIEIASGYVGRDNPVVAERMLIGGFNLNLDRSVLQPNCCHDLMGDGYVKLDRVVLRGVDGLPRARCNRPSNPHEGVSLKSNWTSGHGNIMQNCGGLSKVAYVRNNSMLNIGFGMLADYDSYIGYPKVGAKLSSGAIAHDNVRPDRKPQGDRNAHETDKAGDARSPCPPRTVGRGICGFPLGAQIGATLVIALAAWVCFFWSLRPFGLLSVSRRDIGEGVGYGLLSLCLFTLSFGVGMIGSS